ncbi:hypothetical protein [Dyadobacter sp. 32]|uniref:hypothetical protein n=1 Tax=Dyadobacter sp. 32 TaxID=538966 RepID=UPI0011ED4222
MVDKSQNETRVDILLGIFQNNKLTAILILVGIVVITFAKVTESGDSILRTFGIIKSYNVDQATDRGKFSSQLIENAWNRMFWMRVYTERIRLNANSDDQNVAYQKYIDATEKWSSNIMNYYLGLEQYYPKTDKRNLLEGTIQPEFIEAAKMIQTLKLSADTLKFEIKIIKVDSIQYIVDNINRDFYLLIDQSVDMK